MRSEHLSALFSPAFNLSPEARTLIAYVSTIGAAEVPYARLMRLLHIADEKKLRHVVAEAEDSEWIAVERQTGKGHHPKFKFTPPGKGSVKENRVPEKGILRADRVPEKGSLTSNSPPEKGSLKTEPEGDLGGTIGGE